VSEIILLGIGLLVGYLWGGSSGTKAGYWQALQDFDGIIEKALEKRRSSQGSKDGK